MRTRLIPAILAIATLSLGMTAKADPDWHGKGGEHHFPSREQRMEMMRKIHTGFIVELGQLLDLDTAGTLRLSDKLKPFDEQRIQVRLEMGDAMQQIRQAAHGGGAGGDVANLARKVAQDRVQLAQLDQRELDAVLQGLPADKVAKVVVFMAEYPKRIERMAHEIRREHWMKEHGPGPGPGPDGEE